MQEIRIIHEPTKEKPFLIIDKPRGLPSAPLHDGDSDNALCRAAALFPEIRLVRGKKPVELGLIHRLDTATSGLMIIAATQECYDFLLAEQKAGKIIKTYRAVCDVVSDNADVLGGFPPLDLQDNPLFSDDSHALTLRSFFRHYGEGRKEVRPVTKNSGKSAMSKLGKQKIYTTEIRLENPGEGGVIAVCRISEGFRHQVRCHLAWAGFPVRGDLIYNSRAGKKNAENMMFSATKISFEYPGGDLNSYDRKDTWT